MITIQDIQTAVADTLIKNQYPVIANEVREGFQKPACFIDVLPLGAVMSGPFSETITDSVEISYFPDIETREKILQAAEDFKQIFLYKPLKVCDRFLTISEINFQAENSTLIASFELEFMQEIESDDHYPIMKHLHERTVTTGHGTS